MTTIGTLAAWIALVLVAARVAYRSVLRYRCAQHINEFVVRGQGAAIGASDDVEARS